MDLITELQKEIGQLTQLMYVTIGTLQREAPPARLFANLKRGGEPGAHQQGNDDTAGAKAKEDDPQSSAPPSAEPPADAGALAARLCEDVVYVLHSPPPFPPYRLAFNQLNR